MLSKGLIGIVLPWRSALYILIKRDWHCLEK